ncbi:MAG TPA: site-2 protease family protein [Agriterribacter sp.]|nr:site-2 protease family protein [Agriterribacter sp.]
MHQETLTNEGKIDQQKPIQPELIKKKRTLLKTIISLALYIGVYYYFFHDNVKWILLLTGVILLHEAGHFIAMKYFGYKDVRMFFVPFLGAFVSGEPKKVSQRQRIVTLLAGPLPGMLAGIAFYLLFLKTGKFIDYQLAFMLIMLNAFNLLPVTPLDGGQLLENLVLKLGGRIQKAFLLLSAVLLFYLAVVTQNYFILLIVWLIVIRYRRIDEIYNLRHLLLKDKLPLQKAYDELSDHEYMEIRKKMIAHIRLFKDYEPDSISNDENDIIIYMNKLFVAPVIDKLSHKEKLFIIVLWVILMIVPFVIYSKHAVAQMSLV